MIFTAFLIFYNPITAVLSGLKMLFLLGSLNSIDAREDLIIVNSDLLLLTS
jgi:hypothetical protein